MRTSKRHIAPPKPLTPKERNILAQLEGYEQRIKGYDGKSAEEMEHLVKDKAFAQMFRAYEEAILKAIRAKLDKHPLVPEKVKELLFNRVGFWRALGQWDHLREAKRSFEKGIKRPLTEEQVKLLNAVEELRWGDRPTSLSIHLSQDELASPMTFEEIFRKAGKGEILNDPENPPYEKRPRSWQGVLDILVMRGLIKKMRLKTFMEKIKRLDPTII